MTRREHLERKLEKRRDWAEKRKAESDALFKSGSQMADAIPLGQPILIGHHSEKRDRRYRARFQRKFEKAIESENMAAHHASKAFGLADQLQRSIYSDDPDAPAALEARAKEIEAQADHKKAINSAFRKAPGTSNEGKLAYLVKCRQITKEEALDIAKLWALCPYHSGKPYPSYALTNLRANARRLRQRIEEVQRREKIQTEAESSSSGVLIKRSPDCNWCQVAFAEKPEREILTALKEAGYHWGSGHWSGYLDKLPDLIVNMA